MPPVSIVIPTYNHAHYVKYAIESALAQTYPHLEVIVVDDGSTDNTEEVVQPFLRQIQYYKKGNGGTPNALNYGIMKTSGKYVCWLSADDVFMPEKVSQQVLLMERNQDLGFCYTSFKAIDAVGQDQYEVHSQFYPDIERMVRNLMLGNFINGSSVMMRRESLNHVGLFDESLPQAHDHDLWFRLLRHYQCGFIDEILLAYRWHGKNMSQHPDYACEERVKEQARHLFAELFI